MTVSSTPRSIHRARRWCFCHLIFLAAAFAGSLQDDFDRLDIVHARGSFRTTEGDLVRRAVVDSDSAATDIQRLQTEIVGLKWKPEFVDAAVLDALQSSVSRRM